MARRLEIELTSNRSDGKWTWRAAGAKQPRGTLDGALLPEGTGVGDVVKVEADATLDGLEVTAVLPTRSPRTQVETLQLLGSGREQPLVTSQLAPKIRSRARGANRDRRDAGSAPNRRRRGDRNERRRNDEKGSEGSATKGDRRPDRDARSRDEKRDDRAEGRAKTRDKKRGGADKGASRDQRGKRNSRTSPPQRPKPRSGPRTPRLRPGSKNRRAALAELPESQHLLAEEVLKGGVPGLRKTIDRMNKMAQAEGIPKVKSEPLVALAEKLTPDLNSAVWRDRAEAAIAGIDKVDLRDIRSVVVAADSGARDEESRELAEKLREGLSARVESEHRSWLNEIAEHLADGRIVRALRLSSHPPKAGAPLPFDMADRLTSAASESLSSDVAPQRWATVLDAVAFSPVRSQVTPQGCPPNPNEQLLSTVRRLAPKVPEIAALFGITPSGPPKRPGTKRRPTPPPPPTVSPVEPVAEEPVAEPAVESVAEEPVAEPAVESVAEEPVAEPAVESVAEEPVAEPPVESVAEEPVAEPPVESVAEEPVAEPAVESVAEEPVAEPAVESVAEEPPVEPLVEPVAEAPVAEPAVESVAEEPVVEEPAVEPVATEPVAEEDPTPPPPSAQVDPTEKVDK